MYANRENSIRWLRGLFYIHLAGCLLSALALLSTAIPFAVGSWYTWTQRAMSLGIVVCLYLLPGRYRLAAMAKALGLLCGLISLVFYRVLYGFGVQLDAEGYELAYTLLGRASDILALIAMILEYTAHANTAPDHKQKWYIFLGCSLAVTLISSVVAALLQPVFNEMVNEGSYGWIKLWNIGARTLSLAVSIIYLVLLQRVIHTQQEVD